MKQINEMNFNLGSTNYTSKKLSPQDILDLANAYLTTLISKLVGKRLDRRLLVASDLAVLTAKQQLHPDKKSGKKALLQVVLQSKLIDTTEYIRISKELNILHKRVYKYIRNSSPVVQASTSAVSSQGHDLFDESINEAVPKSYRDIVRHTKTIKKLEAERKALVPSWKSETDSKKKKKIQDKMKKLTTDIKKLEVIIKKLELKSGDAADITNSGGSASRSAKKDMKGEFDESVNELANDREYVATAFDGNTIKDRISSNDYNDAMFRDFKKNMKRKNIR